MNLLYSFFAASAETSVSATHEATLNDAVQELVDKPEQAFSAIGEFFVNLGRSILSAIPTILFAVLILVLGLLVTKLCLWLISKGMSKTKLEVTVKKFVSQVAKIILYVLLTTIVLSILGIPSTSIITVIGTAGVAIGLALQDSHSKVSGGFMLMITKPFKIGDYIIVNGTEGTVSQISIIHTRLDSASNQAIFIPNGQAVNAVVVNNSNNETRRVDLTYSISYASDFRKAREIILEILENNGMILDDPTPLVRMMQQGESAVVIAARPWCRTSDYWDVVFDTNEQVFDAFRENGIEIPFNQLEVHITDKN